MCQISEALVSSAFRICSNWNLFDLEVEKLRRYFLSNGYPVHFFQRILKRFIRDKLSGSNTTASDLNTDQNHILLVLPYFGVVSDHFVRQFKQLCKRFNLRGRLVFKPFKVSRYFRLKSRAPLSLQSRVIYKYQCLVDPSIAYIGKTKRHLIARVKEHSSQLESAIFNHRLICDCSFSLDNFSVLRSCRNEVELNVCEALYIKRDDPSLNRSVTNHGQSTFLKLF